MNKVLKQRPENGDQRTGSREGSRSKHSEPVEAVLDMDAVPRPKQSRRPPLTPVRFLDHLFQEGCLLFKTPRTVIAPSVVSIVGG